MLPLVALAWAAGAGSTEAWPAASDAALAARLGRITREAQRRFGLERIAATVVDLAGGRRASVRGNRRFYAASLVKVPFAVALFAAVRDGRIALDDGVRRDLAAMLGPSSNDAANRLLDLACGTRPGRALSGDALREFVRRRSCVERRLRRLGLDRLRAAHKLSYASPRDRQHYRFRRPNSVTTDQIARLLFLLHRGEAVDPTADREILVQMRREAGRGHPIDAPFARGLPPALEVYSKAGWTRRWAHDAALVLGAPGPRFILVVCTRQKRPTQHLAWMARRVYEALAPVP